MRKIFLIISSLFVFTSIYSQNDFKDRDLVVKVDLILPSIGIEARVADHNTFLFAYQPGIVFTKINNSTTNITLVPQFKGSARFFYNIDKRNQKGKRTDKFAGNFISIYAIGGPESSVSPGFIGVGPTWGLQRNWDGIIHFSFELGIGYMSASSGVSGVALIGDLKFGIAL